MIYRDEKFNDTFSQKEAIRRSKYNHTATSTYKNSILPNSTNAQPSNKVNYSKFSSQGAFLDKFQPGGIQKGNVILVYHFLVL